MTSHNQCRKGLIIYKVYKTPCNMNNVWTSLQMATVRAWCISLIGCLTNGNETRSNDNAQF